ncbi:MAG TPA: metal-dependent hydrolase [Candidatus Nanoarchaeia archaeon]|nr:metal-dependent hydrolase [Candidatus Nanoarchaeia archaeon]
MFLTHLAFALFLSLMIVKNAVLPVNSYVFVAIILLGSLLPDIDSGTSFIGKRFKLTSLFFKHRGMVHSIIFMTGFSIVVFSITKSIYYFLAFAAGYLSHLLLDSLTPKGVAFFWPNKKRMRGRFRTTGLVDILLLVVFIVLDVLLLK